MTHTGTFSEQINYWLNVQILGEYRRPAVLRATTTSSLRHNRHPERKDAMPLSMVGEKVELRSEVEIAAPISVVWDVLTNLRAYGEWNPFIVQAEGELKQGAIVSTTVNLPGNREQKIRRHVLKLEPKAEIRWTATQLMRVLAYDEQFFQLRTVEDNHVRLSIGQNISGVLAPRTPSELSQLSRSLNLLNQAIKRRAESLSARVS